MVFQALILQEFIANFKYFIINKGINLLENYFDLKLEFMHLFVCYSFIKTNLLAVIIVMKNSCYINFTTISFNIDFLSKINFIIIN